MSNNRDLILTCIGTSVGIGFLCALGTVSFDFPCMPGYTQFGFDKALSKAEAIIAATRIVFSNPLSFIAVFLGFSLLFLAGMLVPLLAPEKSHTRLLMGFALLPLILGSVAWIALKGPDSDCSLGSASLRRLSGVALGAVALYGAAWVWGSRKDSAG